MNIEEVMEDLRLRISKRKLKLSRLKTKLNDDEAALRVLKERLEAEGKPEEVRPGLNE